MNPRGLAYGMAMARENENSGEANISRATAKRLRAALERACEVYAASKNQPLDDAPVGTAYAVAYGTLCGAIEVIAEELEGRLGQLAHIGGGVGPRKK